MSIGPQRQFNGWAWLPLSAALIVLDQLSKRWVVHHFAVYERKRLLSFFDITLWRSGGEHRLFQHLVLPLLVPVVGGGILWWMKRLKAGSDGPLACGLAMILAGAIGNALDRLRTGQVVDFMLAHWNSVYAPAFNFADLAITAGAALLIVDLCREFRGGTTSSA